MVFHIHIHAFHLRLTRYRTGNRTHDLCVANAINTFILKGTLFIKNAIFSVNILETFPGFKTSLTYLDLIAIKMCQGGVRDY